MSSGTTALNPLRCIHISTAEITACLEPIWETNNPTAERLRGYIEDLLDYAVDALDQERKGPNPARAAVVHPRLPEVKHVTKHLRAMPYEEVPAFMAELGLHEGYDARALEFIILSAVRSSVITGKDDGEKDNKVAKDPLLWDHMKEAERVIRPPSPDARKGQFPIPLTDALVLLLQRVKSMGDTGPAVFPVGKNGAYNCLRELRPGKGYTLHGFRTSFQTWAMECTTADMELRETCLSHKIAKSETQGAYIEPGATMFHKRVELIAMWADYVSGTQASDNVVKLVQHKQPSATGGAGDERTAALRIPASPP